MQDFDISKYLREHQLGSYGILNHYVDLKPLKEEDDTTEVELNTEIPYEGPEHKLTGNGEGDEFEQAETVSEIEDSESEFYDTIWGLAGKQIKNAIDTLRNHGFEDEDIKNALITAIDQYDQVFPMDEMYEQIEEASTELADFADAVGVAAKAGVSKDRLHKVVDMSYPDDKKV